MSEPSIPLSIEFETVRAATYENSEEALLVHFNHHIVAVLLPAESGWFLQLGFGPCDQEGIVFQSLSGVEDWVRSNIQHRHLSSE